MTALIRSIHQAGERFDRQAERMAFRHPYIAILVMFIGIPIGILIAVALLTMLASMAFYDF